MPKELVICMCGYAMLQIAHDGEGRWATYLDDEAVDPFLRFWCPRCKKTLLYQLSQLKELGVDFEKLNMDIVPAQNSGTRKQ